MGRRQDRQGRTAKDDLEAAGIKRVKIVTRPPNIWDSINNVRAILPRCFFDQEGCGEETLDDGRNGDAKRT